MTVITTKAISSSVATMISLRAKKGPSPNTSAVPKLRTGGMMKKYALPAYIEYCSSVAIPSVRLRILRQPFSTLQLGYPANVRTSRPEPLVKRGRYCRVGVVAPDPFLLAAPGAGH